MIFVTVGTHDQGFDRLVRAADDLAALIDEEVVIQRGVSSYNPRHATSFEWASSEEMLSWISRSRCVIAQAGAGTIITILRGRKPLVVAPRLKTFQEHYNDHQIELAEALSEQGRAIMVVDLSGHALLKAIDAPTSLGSAASRPTQLIDALLHKLEAWMSPSQDSRLAL
jgi:UDP-N-acetylglucosamine transferase subunit ALG13